MTARTRKPNYRMISRFILYLVFSVFTQSCSFSNLPNAKNFKFPSGKQVGFYDEDKLDLSDGNYALVIGYNTDFSINDEENIRAEINDEILMPLQRDTGKSDLKSGMIMVFHNEHYGLFDRIKHTQKSFSFIRDEEGTLRLKDGEKK